MSRSTCFGPRQATCKFVQLHCMMFTSQWSHLTTHFSGSILAVEWHVTVYVQTAAYTISHVPTLQLQHCLQWPKYADGPSINVQGRTNECHATLRCQREGTPPGTRGKGRANTKGTRRSQITWEVVKLTCDFSRQPNAIPERVVIGYNCKLSSGDWKRCFFSWSGCWLQAVYTLHQTHAIYSLFSMCVLH